MTTQETLAQLNTPRNLANGGARWGFDEAKGAYYSEQGGKRRYQNTNMAGSTTAQSNPGGGGLIRSRGQWDQGSGSWKQPINWGNVLSLGAGAMITGGALSAAGAFGGAGAGAGAAAGAGSAAAPAAAGGAGVAGGFWSSPWLGPIIGAGTDLIGAGMQSSAAGKAADAQMHYNQQALAFAKEQDARDFAEYLKERDRGWQMQDAHEGRMTPYRDFGAQGVKNLSSLMTIPAQGVMRTKKLSDLVRG